MYVVEILEQCADQAIRAAWVYRGLADRFQGDYDRVHLWRELALEGEIHADILRRELKAFQEQEQTGAFLPEFADRLHRLGAEVRQLETRATTARTLDDALSIAVALEQADLTNLYDDLVLQGEPAFRLISERIEAALAAPPRDTPAAGLIKRERPPHG